MKLKNSRAGEMLRETDKNPGGNPNRLQDVTGLPATLEDLGITKIQSHRWQLEAIEVLRAKQRMEKGKGIDPKDNCPQGQSRDIIAETIGLGSGREVLSSQGLRNKSSEVKTWTNYCEEIPGPYLGLNDPQAEADLADWKLKIADNRNKPPAAAINGNIGKTKLKSSGQLST